MESFTDVESFGSSDVPERTAEAIEMFQRGSYKEVIVFVDSLFGWREDELEREGYTQEEAIRCIKVLGGDSAVEMLV